MRWAIWVVLLCAAIFFAPGLLFVLGAFVGGIVGSIVWLAGFCTNMSVIVPALALALCAIYCFVHLVRKGVKTGRTLAVLAQTDRDNAVPALR